MRSLPACALLIAALCCPSIASGDPAREDNPRPAGSDYAFLIGDWDAAVTLRRPNAEALEYLAHWHNRWLLKDLLLIQEWSGPYAQGVELRSFSTAEKIWHGRNIYLPQPGTWYDNTARWQQGRMTVTTHRIRPDGTSIITHEIYQPIDSDHFDIETEMSTDGGQHWQPGRYSARMTRRGGNESPEQTR